MHSQSSQVHQNQQANATYWKSPGVSNIDSKSIGGSVVDAKPTGGVAANFTNQSFPLIHNTQSSFPNVVPPTPQVSSRQVDGHYFMFLFYPFHSH